MVPGTNLLFLRSGAEGFGRSGRRGGRAPIADSNLTPCERYLKLVRPTVPE
jgi:hypothetical protein